MPVRSTAIILLLGAAVGGCGSSSSPTTTGHRSAVPGGPPKASATVSAGPGCGKVTAPPAKGAGHLRAPSLHLDATRTYTVRMLTSCGEIDIRLDVRHSPRTTASFVYLARRGFFDGLTFHRVVSGFVIQGGDPQGNGQGGPGYTVVEAPPPGLTYTRGVVAMAKTASDPRGASGSQFYIVTGPDAGLPPDYALLGRVVAGNSSVTAIDRVANSGPPDNTPLSPVVIDRVTVVVSR